MSNKTKTFMVGGYVIGYWVYLIHYIIKNFDSIEGFFDFNISMIIWALRAVLWPIWIVIEWF